MSFIKKYIKSSVFILIILFILLLEGIPIYIRKISINKHNKQEKLLETTLENTLEELKEKKPDLFN